MESNESRGYSRKPTNTGHTVIRPGLANGDIIVTELPTRREWPWLTAEFLPGVFPEEFMAPGLTITEEDYNHVMSSVTDDPRFHLYNQCYKRIWVLVICVYLVGVLATQFSGVRSYVKALLLIVWHFINVGAIFLCIWIKRKLYRNLERCFGEVNRHLIRHKLILGLDDRGKISCDRVNLCFIYFDPADCIKKLQEVIDEEERKANREETVEGRKKRKILKERIDIDYNDTVVDENNEARVYSFEGRAEEVLTRHIQRWIRDFLRKKLNWTIDLAGGNPVNIRHSTSSLCPCQYIEGYLQFTKKTI